MIGFILKRAKRYLTTNKWLANLLTVCFLLMCLFSKPLVAQNSKVDLDNIKVYGSFIHFTEVPNALFFFKEIKKNDTFEFRKALRNHDVDTIVLGSPGGSVFEGLSIAGVIFDRKLNAYIPDGQTCASACSFLFFAGKYRMANGELGVHQFNTGNSDKSVNEGTSLFASQFTASEIIGFLNEFKTPPFVYEHMFATISSDMYFFSKKEMQKINSNILNQEVAKKFSEVQKFLERLKKLQKLEDDKVETKKRAEDLKKRIKLAVEKDKLEKEAQKRLEDEELEIKRQEAKKEMERRKKLELEQQKREEEEKKRKEDIEKTQKLALEKQRLIDETKEVEKNKLVKEHSEPQKQSNTQRPLQLKRIQAELNTLGCGNLEMDGVIGYKTRIAFKKFNTLNRSNFNLSNSDEADLILSVMTSKKGGWCRKTFKEAQKTKGDGWFGTMFCNSTMGKVPARLKIQKTTQRQIKVLSFIVQYFNDDRAIDQLQKVGLSDNQIVLKKENNGNFFGIGKIDGYSWGWRLTELTEDRITISIIPRGVNMTIANLLMLGAGTCELSLKKVQN